MKTTLSIPLAAAFLAGALAGAARATETITYADEDGSVHTAEVRSVAREDLKELAVTIRDGRAVRTLKLPARRVISLQRGDSDAENQWSKKLAHAYRLLAGGTLVTKENVPGAEEVFEKIAYSTEEGVKGQEKSEKISPWQNMYALRYLIETRYEAGKAGKNPDLLKRALANVEEFRKRTEEKAGKKIDWDVPFEKGTTRKSKVYCFGDNWLLPQVMLLRAKILRELKDPGAASAFDDVVALVKKNELSPLILCDAIVEKADMLAEGKSNDAAEAILREAGNALRNDARAQKEPFTRDVLAQHANQALLRGADLLLAMAADGKVSFDVPLARYKDLRDSAGKDDPALAVGAQAGVGVCLAESKRGGEAYRALLEVVVGGFAHPEQVARALYYLGKAAALYADEIDKAGGKGDLFRDESRQWLKDVQERFPGTLWAEKAKA